MLSLTKVLFEHLDAWCLRFKKVENVSVAVHQIGIHHLESAESENLSDDLSDGEQKLKSYLELHH